MTTDNSEKLIQEAWSCRYTDTVTCVKISEKLEQLAKINNDDRALAWSFLLKNLGNFLLSKEDNFLESLFTALKWFEKHPEDYGYSACLYYIGNIYESYGNYDEALRYAHDGIRAAEESDFQEGIGDALSIAGIIYSRLEDHESAIEHYLKSYAVREKLQNYPAMASTLNLIGRSYSLMNDFNNAHDFYKKSLEIREENNDSAGLPWSLLGTGSLMEKFHRNIEAAEYFRKGLELNKTTGDIRYDMQCILGLGRISLKSNELSEAEAFLKEAEAIGESLNAKPLLYETYRAYAELYKKKNQPAEALQWFEKYHNLKEEVINNDTQHRIKNQQISFAVEKSRKEAEIHQLRNIELKKAYDEIAEINKDITDSINYAFRIQKAIVPSEEWVKSLLPESFIFWRPRDIVSGDFYFAEKVGDIVVFTAVDCTGHGIPGALLSVAGYNFLSQAVNEKGITKPSEILKFLDEGINSRLNQEGQGETVKDGMDIALCCLDKKTLKLQYAGAYNPMYYIRNHELIEIKANAYPIGVNTDGVVDEYTNHEIQMQKGDSVYLFSDGYADQFGGPKGKKFMYRQLKKLFLKIYQLPMNEQEKIIADVFDRWKGNIFQVDDVIIFGVKI